MCALKAVTPIDQQYIKYSYTYKGITYTGVHTFTTKAGTQSIMPAIAPQFKNLETINPATVAAQNVICKTNGFTQTYGTNLFYGVFYQGKGHPVYVHGISSSSVETVLENNPGFKPDHLYPSFCVKTDGTATIRWFFNRAQLVEAANHCQCIFGAYHPLVYNGQNVMVTRVYDKYDGELIFDPSNVAAYNVRFKAGEAEINSMKKRTLLGHKSGNNGIYIMVCVDSGMPLRAAAAMMLELGCDYAVNLDGGLPSEMRVKKGYGAEGKVTNGSSLALPTAVCAFKKQ